jgi:hypothetical protein
VIDGISYMATTVALGNTPGAMVVNPIINNVYVGGGDLVTLTEQQVQPIPLLTQITPLTANQTISRTPSFSFQTISTYEPVTPTPLAVYFQVDTWQGPWTQASGSNPAFSGQTGPLLLGTHVLYVYASDGQDVGIDGNALNGQVAIGQIAAYPFTVMQASTATALTADVNPSVPGATVTLTATVTASATGTPTGTVTFLDGTTALGASSVNSSGVATFVASTLAAGTHSLTAQYGGDANFALSTSPVLSQVVQIVQSTTITALSPPSAASYGTPVTFTGTVTSSSSGEPTGTISFLDGTTVLGTGTLNSKGVATLTTATLTVGTHSITCRYAGSANFASSISAAMTETVTLAPTTATLVSSAAASSTGAPVTFTATIMSSISGTPTGTVTFLDGATSVGTGALNPSAVAAFTTSTLSVGTHPITATYAGDANFAASTSTVLSQVVSQPSFTIAASSSRATVSAGNPAVFQIVLTPKNNFSGAVTLSCAAGLPSGATCSSPGASIAQGATSATSTLTISTTARTTALLLPFSGGQEARLFAQRLLIPALVLGFLGLGVARRRLRLGYALALLLVGCVVWQAGCASAGSNVQAGSTMGTPAGAYAVTVTGTAGAAQQTVSLTLVVQ